VFLKTLRREVRISGLYNMLANFAARAPGQRENNHDLRKDQETCANKFPAQMPRMERRAAGKAVGARVRRVVNRNKGAKRRKR
jgi:hypothetical protein